MRTNFSALTLRTINPSVLKKIYNNRIKKNKNGRLSNTHLNDINVIQTYIGVTPK